MIALPLFSSIPRKGKMHCTTFQLTKALLLGLMILTAENGLMHPVRAEIAGPPRPLPSKEELARLPPDGGPNWNRLVFERSPYLLQHAANPVDWYPWGEAAFKAAREQGKPIFLSIGYSTCHWCHVMEHESFEDLEVAALLNEYFISIKVDREERPDVDQIYMTVCQALTGSGGWPLTVFLTPEKKPFYAATYIPKRGLYGRPGMLELLPQVAATYKVKHDELLQGAEEIVRMLRQAALAPPGDALTSKTLTDGFYQLRARYDAQYGGFGSQPKFPTPHNLTFMLRQYRRMNEPEALAMVEHTLRQMRLGGVFDHVGFGFHRYSTDERWFLPHFEKMLYDQALLIMAYTEAWQVTGKDEYQQTAREITAYVLRDMTAPQGGFYSAEDADSEGEEGLFYLWKPEQVLEIAGAEDGGLFNRVYNIVPEGNYREEATGLPTGLNIPHLRRPMAEIAAELKLSEQELRAKLEAIREKLFAEREKRIHPLKDDKILTDWNGLMIAALAQAGSAFGEPSYVAAAQQAADFVLANLRGGDGRLLKRWRDGAAGLPAHLEDHAFLVWGLLNLYEATFDTVYFERALELNRIMLDHFIDAERGGFFQTADDGEELIVRGKDIYDGAQPSGNSVAALNLLRLARMTSNTEFEQQTDRLLRAFSTQVLRAPAAHTQLLNTLDFAVGPAHEIVIAGNADADDTRQMLAALRREYTPNKVVLFRPDGAQPPAIAALAPFTANQLSLDGQATAYVCRNFACEQPTTSTLKMLEFLRSDRR